MTDVGGLPSVSAVPVQGASGFYAIRDGEMASVVTELAAFEDDLCSRIGSGKAARKICALGHFDGATGEMEALASTGFLRPGQ